MTDIAPMTNEEHDQIVKICVEEVQNILDTFEQKGEPFYKGEDESSAELGSRLFDVILPVIDEHYEKLSRFEAVPISDICYEVAWDVIHSDILGELVEYRDAEDYA